MSKNYFLEGNKVLPAPDIKHFTVSAQFPEVVSHHETPWTILLQYLWWEEATTPTVKSVSTPVSHNRPIAEWFLDHFVGSSGGRAIKYLRHVLVLSAILISNTPSLWSQVDLIINPATNTVQVSETFEVKVLLRTENAQKVDLAEVYLNFDPTLLKVESINPSGSELEQSIFSPFYNNATGVLGFIGSTLSDFPVGNLELIDIIFSVKAAGESVISFYDPTGPSSTILTFKGSNLLNATLGATVSTLPAPSGSFMMVDAISDIHLFPIYNGLQISKTTIGTRPMGIVFHPATPPGSVRLTLTGPIGINRNEGVAPYSLFGDNNGNISGVPFPSGTYSLNANPASGPSVVIQFEVVSGTLENQAPTAAASGVPDPSVPYRINFSSAGSADTDGSIVSFDWAFGDGQISSHPNPYNIYGSGGLKTVSLTVTDDKGATATSEITANATEPNLQRVVNFVLVNALSDTDIKELQTNDLIVGSGINFRANTNPVQVGSVRMVLSGPVQRTSIESVAPYALYGDNPGPPPDYTSRNLPDGSYNLTATPYELAGAKGKAGQPLSLQFSVGIPVAKVNQPASLLKMHPNPAAEEVRLDFTSPVTLEQFFIYDVGGRLIKRVSVGKEFTEESYLFQLRDLPEATYFIRLRDVEGNEIQKRLVIKRN